VVDYTERRKTEREKRKNVCFHHYIIGHRQREEIFFFFREIKNSIFKFHYAIIKFLRTFFKSFVVFVAVY